MKSKEKLRGKEVGRVCGRFDKKELEDLIVTQLASFSPVLLETVNNCYVCFIYIAWLKGLCLQGSN